MPLSAAWARSNPTSKDRPQSCRSDSNRPTKPWLSSKQPIVPAPVKPNLCLSEIPSPPTNMRQKNSRCETFPQRPKGLLALFAVLIATVRMHHPVARISLRPHQQQQVLPRRNRMRLVDELLSRSDRLAVHFENHVSRSKPRILRRTRGTNALHRHAVHLRRNMQLLPHIRSQLSDSQSQLALLRTRCVAIARDLSILLVLADLYIDRLSRSIANNAQRDLRPR